MKNKSAIQDLVMKYMNNTASEEEVAYLFGFIDNSPEYNWADLLNPFFGSTIPETEFSRERWQPELRTIIHSGVSEKNNIVSIRKRTSVQRWVWLAAAALIAVVAGIYMLTTNLQRHRHQDAISGTIVSDIQPGTTGAVLTLSDGRELVLDSAGNGVIANQNGVRVKLENGQLSYGTLDNTSTNVNTAFNSLSTPRGRQFQVTLPDGTHVWLNSASTLRYPTIFKGTERKIFVTGEVYMEVTKDPAHPFIVVGGENTEVEVLGTSFNMNTYENQPASHITLLEGSIRVRNGQQQQILSPGEQALTKAGLVNVKTGINTEKVIAWKNGAFNFEDVTLEEALREIERWYNIDVVIEKGVPRDAPFYGKISRQITLVSLLTVLKKTSLHFSLEENRKLVVRK